MVGLRLLPLHAGNEQCMVTVRDFELCDSLAGAAWWVAFVRDAGKHWATVKSDLRRIGSVLPYIKVGLRRFRGFNAGY